MTAAEESGAPFATMLVSVARVRMLSPTFRRVTFTGPTVREIADTRCDQRIKLLLPTPSSNLEEFVGNHDWYAAWRAAPEANRPIMRTYTLREVRAESAEFDVDFVLHGRSGPASAWAGDAQPGDTIAVVVPVRGYSGRHGGIDWNPPTGVGRVLIAADETALPAVSGIFERMDNRTQGIAVIEVPHAGDVQALSPAPPGIDLRVVVRSGEPGSRLVPAVAAAAMTIASATTVAPVELSEIDIDTEILWEVPDVEDDAQSTDAGGLYAWLAGESAAIKSLRRLLVSELGVPPQSVAFMGYWRMGQSSF
ncbi:MAG TPA: siderophore-interacting protein [Microbacteriaceae bacterium]|nr:siderophore-interacting protein [Microbacteriaceae bacterium]